MKQKDLISGIFLFLFGLGVFIKSLTYPLGTFRMPGGGFFPLIASIFLMGLSGALVMTSLLKRADDTVLEAPFFPEKETPKRIFFGFLSLLGYRYLLPLIGFKSSTGLFVFFLMVMLGNYKWKFSLVFSFIIAVVAYFLFQVWLQIPLPISIFANDA